MPHYQVFPASFVQAAHSLKGVGAIDESAANDFDWSTLPAVLRDLYIAHNQTEMQQRVLELNIARAAAGQPPLNIDLRSLQPGVQVGLAADVKTLLGALGIGAIGVLAFAMRKRGK